MFFLTYRLLVSSLFLHFYFRKWQTEMHKYQYSYNECTAEQFQAAELIHIHQT